MYKNMGTFDKAVRILLAAVVTILFFTDILSGTLGLILFIVAIVFVLTSMISFCPLYLPLGIKTTCAKKEK